MLSKHCQNNVDLTEQAMGICNNQPFVTSTMAVNAQCQPIYISSQTDFNHVLMREGGEETLAVAAAQCFPVSSSWVNLALLSYATDRNLVAWGFKCTCNGHHIECNCAGKSQSATIQKDSKVSEDKRQLRVPMLKCSCSFFIGIVQRNKQAEVEITNACWW